MNDKTFPMTLEGKQKLELELEDLRTKKRPEIINRIKIARSFGDLSENSEYEAAKDEQSFIENRIKEINDMLNHAEIIDKDNFAPDEICLGKTITFKEDGENDTETYQIVGAAESDPFNGKISNESPIAEGLIGHKKGDNIIIHTPGGDINITIIDVK